MPEPPLSPSQQVERIREILVGRQMQQVEERLERLERLVGPAQVAYPSPFPSPAEEPASSLKAEASPEEHTRLEQQVAQIAGALAEAGERINASSSQLAQHDQLLNEDLRSTLEEMNSSLATRVDARVREVLDHLQSELDGLKEQVGQDLQRIEDLKADRLELRARFARLATAAMEDESDLDPEDGFLP